MHCIPLCAPYAGYTEGPVAKVEPVKGRGPMTGLFISFEGVDGVGKTTQVERLRAHFAALGCEVVVTREPGGTALGSAIRQILLHGVENVEHTGVADRAVESDAVSASGATGTTGDATKADIAKRAEALLFAADRAQHVAEVIRPALERGAVVITDRYLDSSLAYQAGGRELTADEIRDLSMWATCVLMPDRTYLLDMDPSAAHQRLQHGEDRMESAGDGFQDRTRRAFLHLAAREPSRFRVIDASWPIDTVWSHVKADADGVLYHTQMRAHDELVAAEHARAEAAALAAQSEKNAQSDTHTQSTAIVQPTVTVQSATAQKAAESRGAAVQ